MSSTFARFEISKNSLRCRWQKASGIARRSTGSESAHVHARARHIMAAAEEELSCPVCMEHTKHEWFCFPCGHAICDECNSKMLARRFLACPTCRTPREGVSQRQVELANQARVDVDDDNDRVQAGRYRSTIFLPDESGGANPFFGSLLNGITSPVSTPSELTPEEEDEALAQVLQAEEMVGVHLPLTRVTPARLAVRGPNRALVDGLMTPAPMSEFLAQREVVRRRSR